MYHQSDVPASEFVSQTVRVHLFEILLVLLFAVRIKLSCSLVFRSI